MTTATLIFMACSLLVGISAGLMVWFARDAILNLYKTHVAWVRESSFRFNPTPINAVRRTWFMYIVAFAVLAIMIRVTGAILIPLGIWIALLFIPRIVVEWAWQARRNKIDDQLPLTIASMANSLRAGLTLVQCVQRLAESAPEPIRTEFKVMANRYAFGTDMEQTITEVKRRLNLPNFNLFASALLVNRQMGGNIAETLTRISISLDKIKQMRQTVKAHTSEGRTNIKVLLCAPFLMLFFVSLVDYDDTVLLFTTRQGFLVLLIASALAGVGIYFASRIVRLDV